MCMSGAGEREARGGGHSGAPHSVILGCCDAREPATDYAFPGDVCSVGLQYFEIHVFGSCMQNLVSRN